MIAANVPCTCSDLQLAHVGCDCAAEQNIPASCADCGCFVRTVEPCGCVARAEAAELAYLAAERAYYEREQAAFYAAEEAPFVDPREDFAEWTLEAVKYQ